MSAQSDFRNNHYVPEWYQRRFLPSGKGNFFYLDLHPERVAPNGHRYRARSVLVRGPDKSFAERDLYTTRLGSWFSTHIERHYFGYLDRVTPEAVEYFATFKHPSVKHEMYDRFVRYLSIQRLRTPKGLAQLAALVGSRNRESTLEQMQRLQHLYAAIWSEGIWCLLDATESPTKFIISDHPVTLYNRDCFPGSQACRGHNDPDIRYNGTHTLFPLGPNRVLVITHLSWTRNPYQDPLSLRPNPALMRNTVFNFLHIQTGRLLSEHEVCEINFIIKQRALNFIAASEREWLFPEKHIETEVWDRLGDGYLLFPDPRSTEYGGEVMMNYGPGRTEAYDSFGRRPWDKDYGISGDSEGADWFTRLAFQGEYARKFGPVRRGVSSWGHKTEDPVDSEDYHKYHLALEGSNKAKAKALGLKLRKI